MYLCIVSLARSPAAASGGCQQQVAAAASSLLIFNSLSLTHCVCSVFYYCVRFVSIGGARELARCNINHTTVTKGIFDLHRSQAKMDPGKRKVETRFVSCFLSGRRFSCFALRRGERFQSGAPIFLIYKRDFSTGNGKYYFASLLSA